MADTADDASSKRTSIRCRLRPEQKAALEAAADRLDVSSSTIVRWAIRDWLRQHAQTTVSTDHADATD